MYFLKDAATTEIYTLSLHDALPIWRMGGSRGATTAASSSCGATGPGPAGASRSLTSLRTCCWRGRCRGPASNYAASCSRSEEHTSELQSRQYLVCRLLLEKKTSAFPYADPGRTLLPLTHSTFVSLTSIPLPPRSSPTSPPSVASRFLVCITPSSTLISPLS